MINLKQDVIRQLNAIYGISFKSKYKEELKERIIFFVNKTFENISFNQLNTLKEYIELKDCEISKIKSSFFCEYKEELLKTLNPLWYETKEKIILTKQEKEYAKAMYLKSIIDNGMDQINEIENKYKTNLMNTIRYSTDRIVLNQRTRNDRQLKKFKFKNIKHIFRKNEELAVLNDLRRDHESIKGALIKKINRISQFYAPIYLKIVEEENFKEIRQEHLTNDFKQAFCEFEISCLLKNIAEEKEKCI